MKRKILIILFVVTVCFIWGNSMLSADISSRISTAFGELLAKLFGGGDGAHTVGGISVRKLAHFVEFCALGVVSSLLLKITVSDVRIGALFSVILGMLIPIIDETIQIFTGRGSSLRDVWIDIGGYVFGCLLVYAVIFFRSFLKKKQP